MPFTDYQQKLIKDILIWRLAKVGIPEKTFTMTWEGANLSLSIHLNSLQEFDEPNPFNSTHKSRYCNEIGVHAVIPTARYVINAGRVDSAVRNIISSIVDQSFVPGQEQGNNLIFNLSPEIQKKICSRVDKYNAGFSHSTVGQNTTISQEEIRHRLIEFSSSESKESKQGIESLIQNGTLNNGYVTYAPTFDENGEIKNAGFLYHEQLAEGGTRLWLIAALGAVYCLDSKAEMLEACAKYGPRGFKGDTQEAFEAEFETAFEKTSTESIDTTLQQVVNKMTDKNDNYNGFLQAYYLKYVGNTNQLSAIPPKGWEALLHVYQKNPAFTNAVIEKNMNCDLAPRQTIARLLLANFGLWPEEKRKTKFIEILKACQWSGNDYCRIIDVSILPFIQACAKLSKEELEFIPQNYQIIVLLHNSLAAEKNPVEQLKLLVGEDARKALDSNKPAYLALSEVYLKQILSQTFSLEEDVTAVLTRLERFKYHQDTISANLLTFCQNNPSAYRNSWVQETISLKLLNDNSNSISISFEQLSSIATYSNNPQLIMLAAPKLNGRLNLQKARNLLTLLENNEALANIVNIFPAPPSGDFTQANENYIYFYFAKILAGYSFDDNHINFANFITVFSQLDDAEKNVIIAQLSLDNNRNFNVDKFIASYYFLSKEDDSLGKLSDILLTSRVYVMPIQHKELVMKDRAKELVMKDRAKELVKIMLRSRRPEIYNYMDVPANNINYKIKNYCAKLPFDDQLELSRELVQKDSSVNASIVFFPETLETVLKENKEALDGSEIDISASMLPTNAFQYLFSENAAESFDTNGLSNIVEDYQSRWNLFGIRKSQESRLLAAELAQFLDDKGDTPLTTIDKLELYNIMKPYMEKNKVAEGESEKELYSQLKGLYNNLKDDLGADRNYYKEYYQKEDAQYNVRTKLKRIGDAYLSDKNTPSSWRSSESMSFAAELQQVQPGKTLNSYNAYINNADNQGRVLHDALSAIPAHERAGICSFNN
jgi:hypothetical protein